MNSIFHRTSVRKYQDKLVEKEKVEQMLRAAMAAPSAMNQQPWEYYVVTRREMIERLIRGARRKRRWCLWHVTAENVCAQCTRRSI